MVVKIEDVKGMSSLITRAMSGVSSSNTARLDDLEARSRRQQNDRAIAACGAGARHLGAKISDLQKHPQWMNRCLQTCAMTDEGGSVVLVGDRGNGKTQCAIQTMKYFILRDEKPLSARYIRMRELTNILLDAQDEGSRQTTIKSFVNPGCLVVDDIHESYETQTQFAYRSLVLIVDMRYADNKPTILVANCLPDKLVSVLGPSIIDRVAEGGGILHFDWPSFRGGKDNDHGKSKGQEDE